MEQDQTHLNFNYLHWAREQLISEYQAKIDRIMITLTEESAERKAAIEAVKYPTKKQIFSLALEVRNFAQGSAA